MNAATIEEADPVAPTSGFAAAGVMTATPQSQPKSRKGKKGQAKGRKDATTTYEPLEMPSEEELLKVYTVGAAMAD